MSRHDAHYHVWRHNHAGNLRRKLRERAERPGGAQAAHSLLAEASLYLDRHIECGNIKDADLVAIEFLRDGLVEYLEGRHSPKRLVAALCLDRSSIRPARTEIQKVVIDTLEYLPAIDREMREGAHKLELYKKRPGAKNALEEAARKLGISYGKARGIWDRHGGLNGYRAREANGDPPAD
jgi:hypothetical protein